MKENRIPEEIIFREAPLGEQTDVERQFNKEKLPICNGCEQTINVNDPEIVILRHKGKLYDEDCLKLGEAKETIVFDGNKDPMVDTKKGSPWYHARKLYLQKKEERKKLREL